MLSLDTAFVSTLLIFIIAYVQFFEKYRFFQWDQSINKLKIQKSVHQQYMVGVKKKNKVSNQPIPWF
jgi:hypothetical protein